MSTFIVTPNMNLLQPNVGESPGPDYAEEINSSLILIDQHDHTSGKGVPITPDAINISSDLSFSSNNATNLRSARFTPQTSALSLPADLGCLYESGVDLYYNDGSGNQIRLTQGGSIVGTAGSISGLPSGTASASYAAGTFVWQAATSTGANMDFASAILRNNTASSKGLTLSPPSAMAADFALVLPNLPASQKIMTLDAAGNMSAPYSIDGSTLAIVSNVIGVKTNGITATQIANGTITNVQIASATILASNIVNNTITATQIANGTITGTQMSSNNNIPGSVTTIDSHVPYVSNLTSATARALAFGSFNVSFDGSSNITAANSFGTTAGVEVSSTVPTNVNFQISPAMSGTPSITIGQSHGSGTVFPFVGGLVQAVTGSGFEFHPSGSPTSTTIIFHFIVAGNRA